MVHSGRDHRCCSAYNPGLRGLYLCYSLRLVINTLHFSLCTRERPRYAFCPTVCFGGRWIQGPHRFRALRIPRRGQGSPTTMKCKAGQLPPQTSRNSSHHATDDHHPDHKLKQSTSGIDPSSLCTTGVFSALETVVEPHNAHSDARYPFSLRLDEIVIALSAVVILSDSTGGTVCPHYHNGGSKVRIHHGIYQTPTTLTMLLQALEQVDGFHA